MHTYDAIIIIRKEGKLYAIADNPKADANFITEEGLLQERWHESAKEDIKKDGYKDNYEIRIRKRQSFIGKGFDDKGEVCWCGKED